MTTAAGLPYPRLSRGLFPWSVNFSSDSVTSGVIAAYTDEPLFAACGVRIAFTERSGGVSTGPFASLDLGAPDMCDNPDYFESACQNRMALACAFGVQHADSHLVCPTQVHGSTILEVQNAGSVAAGISEPKQEEADAVLVNCYSTAALLRFADCLPLILVAPGGAFCVVHCGWRGVVAHLARKSAQKLIQAASCKPEHINAYIGPYIHQECFEVGQDTADIFMREFGEAVLRKSETQPGKWYANMGAAVVLDLLGCDLISDRIADVDKCTFCNTNDFFSYRESSGICGRHGAFAVRMQK